jgi:hypothetical protein
MVAYMYDEKNNIIICYESGNHYFQGVCLKEKPVIANKDK